MKRGTSLGSFSSPYIKELLPSETRGREKVYDSRHLTAEIHFLWFILFIV